jgi:hypothetical protein
MNPFDSNQWIESSIEGLDPYASDIGRLKTITTFEGHNISAECLQLMNLYLVDRQIFNDVLSLVRVIRQDRVSSCKSPLSQLLFVQLELKKNNPNLQIEMSRQEYFTCEDWIEALVKSENSNLKCFRELSPISSHSGLLTFEQICNENYLLQVSSDKERFVVRSLLGSSGWHLGVANVLLKTADVSIIYELRRLRKAKPDNLALFLVDSSQLIREEAERIFKNLQ